MAVLGDERDQLNRLTEAFANQDLGDVTARNSFRIATSHHYQNLARALKAIGEHWNPQPDRSERDHAAKDIGYNAAIAKLGVTNLETWPQWTDAARAFSFSEPE